MDDVLVERMAVSLAEQMVVTMVVLLVYATVYLMVDSLAAKWAVLRDERWVEESDDLLAG